MKNIFWLLCLLFVTSCGTKTDGDTSETEINDNKDSIIDNAIIVNPLTGIRRTNFK